MKQLFILILAALPIYAQASLDLTGPAQARRGEQIQLTLVLSGSAGDIAGIQWDEPAGNPMRASTITTPSTEVQAAGKDVYCEGQRCLIVGLNRNVIPNGPVATNTLTIPDTWALGDAVFDIESALGATADAQPVPITVGPGLTITILSWREDLNDDGKIDGVDLLIAVDQILGRAPCGSADINDDAKCDLFDAMALVSKAISIQ